jgi:hypothetical protein
MFSAAALQWRIMDVLLMGLGLSPLFAARPLMSLVAGGIAFWVLQCRQQGTAPTFVNMAVALMGLALAAVVEDVVKAARSEVEEWVDHLDTLLSLTARAVATALGVLLTAFMLGVWGPPWVQRLFGDSGALAPHLSPTGLWTAPYVLGAMGLSIWCFSWMRERVSGSLSVIPWSAEPAIRRLYGWWEMTVCTVGAATVVAWPTVGAVLFAVCALTNVTAFLLLRDFEERQRTACAACGAKVLRYARYCPACSAERVPSRLGMFGRALEENAEDLVAHRLRLLGARRCGRCAEPRALQRTTNACQCCGAPPFSDAAELEQFVAYADKRALALIPVLALLGLLPVLGAILGLWLYRVSPAGALSTFSRWHDRLAWRVLRRLGLLGLAMLQPLPLVGAVAVPALAGVLHAQSRRAIRAGARALTEVGETRASEVVPANQDAARADLEPG